MRMSISQVYKSWMHIEVLAVGGGCTEPNVHLAARLFVTLIS